MSPFPRRLSRGGGDYSVEDATINLREGHTRYDPALPVR